MTETIVSYNDTQHNKKMITVLATTTLTITIKNATFSITI
jgi:hypothetical protein